MRIDTLPQILKIIPVWRSQRESYPQWVIVPEDRRRRFWQDTREWINLVPLPEDVPEFVDLQFAFEFVWRLERCLRPIFGNLVGFLVTTVNRYLPMLDLDSSLGLRLASKGDTEEPALTREYIGRMCHHLLLSLMRYYREEGDLYSWKKVSIQLHDQLATLQPEYRAGHHYERALLALFELDPQAVRNRITEWPVDDLLPFWESKRAGLLAEIGQVSDAERILLKSSLRTIRSSFHHKPITADYGGRSQESYVMLLLHAVRLSAAIQEGRYSELSELRKDFNDRWHSLRKYGRDPWNELDLFRRALDRPPRNTTDVEEEPSFDIGRVARTRRFLNEDREALDGYAFLRFCEDAGIPFRIPGSLIATESAAWALRHIVRHSPYLARATLARVGDAKHVDQVFDRQSLTGLDFGDIDSLIDRYLRSLEVASADITIGSGFLKNNYGVLLAGVVPEVLSRLSSKCSIASQERLIEFLLSAYRSDNRQAFQGIDHLAVRMLNALSMKQRIDLIPKLIALPILDDLPEMVKSEYPNPFELLVIERDLVGNMSSVPDDTVVKLIEAVASDNQPAREWAASTLGSLHYWGLLSSGLTAQFADALWKQVDDNGVPSKTRYPPHGFLMLPHPSTVDPIAVFKNWARMQRFPIQKDDARVSLTFGGGSLCREIVAASRHLE